MKPKFLSEAKEPKREEKKEAKMPPKARMAVEKKEAKKGFAGYKAGGKVKCK
jgi:hypothetical protein